MIALIRGTVYHRSDSGLVVLVNDIGYEVHVADPASFDVGEEVTFQTYHIVKEDRQELYGFVDSLDYELFSDLVEHVPGVGARTALNLLRSTSAARIVEAVREQNIGALTVAPGVGKKNAERIIVELRPVVNKTYAELLVAEATGAPGSAVLGEVEMALRTLGYSPREIAGALREIGSVKDQAVEELVSDALQRLSRK
jgi:Holliday junction DNA helicase RuvA